MYFHRLRYTTPLQGYIGQRPTSYIVRDLDRTIIQIIIIIIIIIFNDTLWLSGSLAGLAC